VFVLSQKQTTRANQFLDNVSALIKATPRWRILRESRLPGDAFPWGQFWISKISARIWKHQNHAEKRTPSGTRIYCWMLKTLSRKSHETISSSGTVSRIHICHSNALLNGCVWMPIIKLKFLIFQNNFSNNFSKKPTDRKLPEKYYIVWKI